MANLRLIVVSSCFLCLLISYTLAQFVNPYSPYSQNPNPYPGFSPNPNPNPYSPNTYSPYSSNPYAPAPAPIPAPPTPQRQPSALAYNPRVNGGFRTEGDLYTLLWEVSGNVISFKAKVKGTGFVGFGISPYGGMKDADVYFAGIHPNGTTYAHDARERNGVADIDVSQDYSLQYATDDGRSTEVHFQRYLDTGDAYGDLPIRNETQYVIWSVGPPTDTFQYHGPNNRGVIRVNLLNPQASGVFVHTPTPQAMGFYHV